MKIEVSHPEDDRRKFLDRKIKSRMFREIGESFKIEGTHFFIYKNIREYDSEWDFPMKEAIIYKGDLPKEYSIFLEQGILSSLQFNIPDMPILRKGVKEVEFCVESINDFKKKLISLLHKDFCLAQHNDEFLILWIPPDYNPDNDSYIYHRIHDTELLPLYKSILEKDDQEKCLPLYLPQSCLK